MTETPMAQDLSAATNTPIDAAIRQAAMDYVEGGYDGDPARMERSLHPDLAWRLVVPNADASGDRLDQKSTLTYLRSSPHNPIPAHQREMEITVLDRYGSI